MSMMIPDCRSFSNNGCGPGSIYAAHALDAIEQFVPQVAVAEP
ncbi:MAG TPA: hypothetical protein VK249_31230 [Anaerolineales bacterium]|nr:hypothetical protein [Anaerolineales bacterium]